MRVKKVGRDKKKKHRNRTLIVKRKRWTRKEKGEQYLCKQKENGRHRQGDDGRDKEKIKGIKEK